MSYSNKNITVFCGHICSGKSTEAKKYASLFKEEQTLFIEVSDIVKEILNEESRDKLQGHPELDTKILITILNKIQNSKATQVIISGPRQLSIIKGLSETFGFKLTVIWVEVEWEIAKIRFKKRNSLKDIMLDYKDVYQKDIELGMGDVEVFCLDSLKFSAIGLPISIIVKSIKG